MLWIRVTGVADKDNLLLTAWLHPHSLTQRFQPVFNGDNHSIHNHLSNHCPGPCGRWDKHGCHVMLYAGHEERNVEFGILAEQGPFLCADALCH